MAIEQLPAYTNAPAMASRVTEAHFKYGESWTCDQLKVQIPRDAPQSPDGILDVLDVQWHAAVAAHDSRFDEVIMGEISVLGAVEKYERLGGSQTQVVDRWPFDRRDSLPAVAARTMLYAATGAVILRDDLAQQNDPWGLRVYLGRSWFAGHQRTRPLLFTERAVFDPAKDPYSLAPSTYEISVTPADTTQALDILNALSYCELRIVEGRLKQWDATPPERDVLLSSVTRHNVGDLRALFEETRRIIDPDASLSEHQRSVGKVLADLFSRRPLAA